MQTLNVLLRILLLEMMNANLSVIQQLIEKLQSFAIYRMHILNDAFHIYATLAPSLLLFVLSYFRITNIEEIK